MTDQVPQFSTSDDSKTTDSTRLVEVITEALLDKKAEGITTLDVRELTTLADMFVVCHATTDVQIKAIADNVHSFTRDQLGETAWKEEGRDTRRWVVMDYVNVVVHIFKKELREYYSLERMWNDAEVEHIES